jgi:hypothetical protein
MNEQMHYCTYTVVCLAVIAHLVRQAHRECVTMQTLCSIFMLSNNHHQCCAFRAVLCHEYRLLAAVSYSCYELYRRCCRKLAHGHYPCSEIEALCATALQLLAVLSFASTACVRRRLRVQQLHLCCLACMQVCSYYC